MKHKIVNLLVILCILLFGGSISAMAENGIEIDTVEVNQNSIKVEGTIQTTIKSKVSCIVTDENENVVYLNQTLSDDSGNFVFDFFFSRLC